MKLRQITGTLAMGLILFASTADAAILTTAAHDFHAASFADQGKVGYGISGVANTGTSSLSIIGAVKRNPSSAIDGSQTVTVEGYNPSGVTSSGVVWAFNNVVLTSKLYSASASGAWSKTVTFTAAEAPTTVYYDVQVFLGVNAVLAGAYVN